MLKVSESFKWPLGESWLRDPQTWVLVEAEGEWDPDDNTIGDLRLAFSTDLGNQSDAVAAFTQVASQYAAIENYAVSFLCERSREARKSA